MPTGPAPLTQRTPMTRHVRHPPHHRRRRRGRDLLTSPTVAAPRRPPPPPARPTGLYGAADPTYDGVFRQSLALMGLAANDIAPAGRGRHLAARPAVRRRLLPGVPRRPVAAVRQGRPRELHRTRHQLDRHRAHGADGPATTAGVAHPERDAREGRPRRRQGRHLAAASSRTPTAAGRTTRAARRTPTRPGLSLVRHPHAGAATDVPAYRQGRALPRHASRPPAPTAAASPTSPAARSTAPRPRRA